MTHSEKDANSVRAFVPGLGKTKRVFVEPFKLVNG